MADEEFVVEGGTVAGADLTDLGSTTQAATGAVIGRFDAAVASGDPEQISVELTALQRYYNSLWEIHDRLERTSQQTHDKLTRASAQQQTGLAHRAADHGHGIHGVDAAVRTARHIAGEHEQGLTSSLRSVRGLITQNLGALYDSYTAYLNTDAAAAQELDRAGAMLGTGGAAPGGT